MNKVDASIIYVHIILVWLFTTFAILSSMTCSAQLDTYISFHRFDLSLLMLRHSEVPTDACSDAIPGTCPSVKV